MPISIHADPVPLKADADGTVRVAGTRVTLATVVAHYRDGASAETIAERFPVLAPADVHAALAYYLRHRDELDRHLAEQARAADAAVAALGERHQPWPAVRDRLERRAAGGTGGDVALPGG